MANVNLGGNGLSAPNNAIIEQSLLCADPFSGVHRAIGLMDKIQ